MHTLLSDDLIKQYYAAGFWRNDTIYSLARAHAEQVPQSFALRERQRRLTYRELVAGADALAADLAQHGLEPGDRVAVWLPNRIERVIALLACSRNGFVCCPSLHRDHTVAEVLELVQRTRAAAFIGQEAFGADADRRDVFADVAALPHVRKIYRLTPAASAQPWAMTARHDARMPQKQDPDQVVYIAFTSGTSGRPKGVMHSDNTLLANARQMAKDWSIGRDAVVFSLSPLSHNLGFGAQVMALAAGAELVVNDLPRGASLVDRILETDASFLVGVPAHASDLLAEMRARGLQGLGRVRGFRISGAAAPREVVAGLLERGIFPQSGYGMTETCSHQYTLPDDDPALIVETSGRACAGFEVRIFKIDDADAEAAVGEVGQIGARGASLMLGYYEDAETTRAAFNRHGYFMTGDLGTLDARGYLRITGRLKDIIIRGGHNIHPARIEALAMRHPAVARAAAVPVKDARLGEKVCLVVMPQNGAQVLPAELLAHLDAAGLSKYEMPEFFLQLDEIPLTANGKIRKGDIVQLIASGQVTPEPVRFGGPPREKSGLSEGSLSS
ncbi:MAG TPA: class I adenylate-forming enzyme family protein [Xanthobacteraceae bacterium]|nr:class I adenylate-forming enzyme family protein [Xanthobacteraceae bacterium]